MLQRGPCCARSLGLLSACASGTAPWATASELVNAYSGAATEIEDESGAVVEEPAAYVKELWSALRLHIKMSKLIKSARRRPILRS